MGRSDSRQRPSTPAKGDISTVPHTAQLVAFPSTKPSRENEVNAVAAPETPLDLITGEMLSLMRDQMVSITNYMEALCARALTASTGGPAITVVTDGTSSHVMDTG